MISSIPLSMLVLGLMSTVAVALWLSGISITGQMVGSSGSSPDSVYIVQDASITNDSVHYYEANYFNDNGEVDMVLTGSMDLVSENDNCVLDENDYVLEIMTDGVWTDAATGGTITLSGGDNPIEYRIVPHANRCPATGTYSVTGVIG